MDTQQLSLYAIATLALIWVGLFISAKTQRSKQWLISSSMTGALLLPLLALTWPETSLEQVTLLSGYWSLLEIGIISGLAWGICSAAYTSQSQGQIKQPLNMTYPRVALFYALLLVAMIIGAIFNLDSQIPTIALLGLAGLAFSFQDRRLLAVGLATGGIAALMTTLVAFGVPYFSSELVKANIFGIESLLQLESIVLSFAFGFAALPTSYWWFKQPIKLIPIPGINRLANQPSDN